MAIRVWTQKCLDCCKQDRDLIIVASLNTVGFYAKKSGLINKFLTIDSLAAEEVSVSPLVRRLVIEYNRERNKEFYSGYLLLVYDPLLPGNNPSAEDLETLKSKKIIAIPAANAKELIKAMAPDIAIDLMEEGFDVLVTPFYESFSTIVSEGLTFTFANIYTEENLQRQKEFVRSKIRGFGVGINVQNIFFKSSDIMKG